VTWRGAYHDFNANLLEAVFPNARGKVLDRAHLLNAREPVLFERLVVVDRQAPDSGPSNKLWYSFVRKESDTPTLRHGLGPDTTEDLLRRVRCHFDIPTRPRGGDGSGGGGGGRRMRVGVIRREGVRSLSAQRYLELVEAILNRCDGKADVEEVRFETMSMQDQLRKDAELDVLVGVHGAGLTHGLFLDRGSLIVEIMPDGARDWCYQTIAEVAGHEHACWFGGEGFVHRPWQTSSSEEATRDVNHEADCNVNAVADRVRAFVLATS